MIGDKKLLSEFFGILSGDGFLGKTGRSFQLEITGHPNNDFEYYTQFVSPLLEIIFGKKPSFRTISGGLRLKVYSKKKVLEVSSYGFPIGKKGNFGVPKFIMENKELWCPFLRGYFDTDGCIFWDKRRIYAKPYPRFHFASISERLSNDVFFMLKELGFKVIIKKRRPIIKNEQYLVEMYGYKNLERWKKLINSSNISKLAGLAPR